jgi:uracil-DNA glycosylase family 4
VKDIRDELAALSASLRGRLADDARRGKTRVRFTPPTVTGTAPRGATAPPPPRPKPASAPALPTGPAAPRKRGAAAPAAAAEAAGRGKKLSVIPPEPPAGDYGKRMEELAALAETASTCTKCGLCETRNRVVFARGRARNRVMFIGEAPGADEDAQGLPFVGRAGKLLDQIIDAAGFSRDDIYVANILKCRPPQNRDPRPEETAACTPFLEAQIELVNPKIICALGRHAAQVLTGKPGAPMGQLRGRIHYYRDRIPVLPTYHPAALLRNPGWKRTVWEDVQVLRKEYLAP